MRVVFEQASTKYYLAMLVASMGITHQVYGQERRELRHRVDYVDRSYLKRCRFDLQGDHKPNLPGSVAHTIQQDFFRPIAILAAITSTPTVKNRNLIINHGD